MSMKSGLPPGGPVHIGNDRDGGVKLIPIDCLAHALLDSIMDRY